MQDKSPFIAYFSDGLGGYEIHVQDGRESVIWRYVPPGCGPSPIHRCHVRHTAKGRPYFMAHGRRVHLDKCIRREINP